MLYAFTAMFSDAMCCPAYINVGWGSGRIHGCRLVPSLHMGCPTHVDAHFPPAYTHGCRSYIIDCVGPCGNAKGPKSEKVGR